jgi:hypothetical protein
MNSLRDLCGRVMSTQLIQSLTDFLEVKPANAMAQADLKASRQKAQQTENDVALTVHQLYYKVLIGQAHRSASEALCDLPQRHALFGDRVIPGSCRTLLRREPVEVGASSTCTAGQRLRPSPTYAETPFSRARAIM